MTKGEHPMVVYVYDLSAAEMAQVEGGSFSWGEVNSPDYLIRLRRVVGD
jgi:hypothetical protein